MTYRCGACGARIVVPSWAAWPASCPSCDTSPPPLALGLAPPALELVSEPSVLPSGAGGAPIMYGDLFDRVRELGGAA